MRGETIMGESPFIKFYPSDFLGGTSGLSPAERGVYITLLCLIYENDGPIPRDDGRLSRRCGSPKAAFIRVLDGLLAEGKIVEVDGMLSNKRAEKAIVDRANRTQNSTHAAQQRWSAQGQKDQQNQSADDAGAMPPQCVADASQKPEPEPDISKRDTNVSLALSAPEPASPLAEAVTIYNETASRVGWPKMQKLTPARSQALRGRLKDCGGIEGWQIAMSKAEASNFLCGRATGTTPATFDWITKQANFTKLMEGNYDNRTGNVSKHPNADAADRQIAFAAAARRTPSQDCF
jgi:uncharacterized protein YdaU (DUF1376 family)